ncbi:MAG: septum formation initiator family protein [Myxococcales bacterium]|nr:septum formation initiator family protein [Myxococcales bacterium]MCB9522071.1 septum formation initiator family protein [Myxococcales bacterium]
MRSDWKGWAKPALITVAVAGLVWIISAKAVAPELEARNAALEADLSRQRAANARLEEDIQQLRAELERLRARPDEQLHHARTQLGMVKPGEVVYQLGGRASDR